MLGAFLATAAFAGQTASRPNVLIIVPDDLSFDDFSYFNPNGPRTPQMDRLARESVQLSNFHVSPSCAPTRAALLTGRNCNAAGVWHTVRGRYFLRADEITMADVFQANGYRTALFGKWHLGDNYPFRPNDRGFEHTVMLRGGGIDQQPSPWGSRDTPPATLFINEQPVPLTAADGRTNNAYTTDFFTRHAIAYMRDCATRSEPFFAYVPFNIAHSPHDAPPDSRPGVSALTGAVENMDANIGRMLAFLDESGLADNTLLLFFTDNGMASSRFRGGKVSHFEGGHRVPCFVRWKAGGGGGSSGSSREVDRLISHSDVLPTLMDLLALHDVAKRSRSVPITGHSVKSLLDAETANDSSKLARRAMVVDNQRLDELVKYKQACVMQQALDQRGGVVHEWRLSREADSTPWQLYDLLTDPKQATNLVAAPEHRKTVKSLQSAYESWWKQTSQRADEYSRTILGSTNQPEVCLYAHDWHGDGAEPPWNHDQVAAARPRNGFHTVEFTQAAEYTFSLRRWPREIASETTLTSALATPIKQAQGEGVTLGQPLPIHSARLRITAGKRVLADERKNLAAAADEAAFHLTIPFGPATIETWFYDADGKELCGAYYVYVAR